MNRRPLRFAALAYAAAVLWVTVGPAPGRTRGNQVDGGILNLEAWASSATWTTGYLAEMALNVAIFVPVGVLAALSIPRRRWPLALLAGLGLTAAIELLQLLQPDRISDPRDLVMNTAGTVVGVLLVLAARMVRRAGAVLVDVTALVDVTTPGTPTDAAPGAPGQAHARLGMDAVGEPALMGAGSTSGQRRED